VLGIARGFPEGHRCRGRSAAPAAGALGGPAAGGTAADPEGPGDPLSGRGVGEARSVRPSALERAPNGASHDL
jgi:hypothetical protein